MQVQGYDGERPDAESEQVTKEVNMLPKVEVEIGIRCLPFATDLKHF